MIAGLLGTFEREFSGFYGRHPVQVNGVATITDVVARPADSATLLGNPADALPRFGALARLAAVAQQANELIWLLHRRPPAAMVRAPAARGKGVLF
jgi:hypothetical protein